MRGVMGIGLILPCLLAPAGASAPQQASRLPVAYWKLDEAVGPTSFASIGSLHGVWNGTPTPVSSPLPPLSYNTPGSRAIQLNGALPDDFIEIPSGPALDNLQEGSYSISAWIRPASVPTGAGKAWNASCALVMKKGYHSGLRYGSGRHVQFDQWLAGGDQPFSTAASSAATSFVVRPDGAWRHVAGCWDRADGIVRVYVDGVQRGSAPAAGSAWEYGANLWRIGIAIPGNGVDYSWPFDGMIDDVRMYNFALDARQAGILAAGVPPPTGVTASPGIQEVTLRWTPPGPANYPYTYRISRSADGGPFALLEHNASGSSYVDTTAITPNGQGPAYTYQITAVSVAESGIATSNSALPLLPDPRTKDHDEGFFGDNCACGAAAIRPEAGVLALLAALTLLSFRRVQ